MVCQNKKLFLVVAFLGFCFLSGQCDIATAQGVSDNREIEIRERSISVFPILMYDSDIGFGFGGKGVVKNQFQKNESFDLMLFGSTKGEQRYALVFSVPDYEIRQGTAYPWAVDVLVEWNKLLNSNFFGIGNESLDNDFQFPKESTRIEATVGHAFHEKWIGELLFRYHNYSIYDYDPDWQTITDQTPGAGETEVSAISALLKYDIRDSQINPSRGIKWELRYELAVKILNADWDFQKFRMEFSGYQQLFNPKHVLAFRYWMQHVRGDAPYYELSKIGDGWTARGYKADRFLDRVMALTSVEYRFPVYKKLGGVVLMDAGRVWPEMSKWNLDDWHSNVGWGLRYYLANFVVRFDMGFSREGSRIFFNFGHVF